MTILLHILKQPFGTQLGQFILRKQVKICHWLMGIGSGTNVEDSGEASVVNKFIRDNGQNLTVFDVGANKGQFLNMVVSRLGPHLGNIHSFEPASSTYEALKINAPKKDGVFLNNFGLSRETGTAQLFYDRENSGLASLTKRDLSFRKIYFEKQETVFLSSIDDYCHKHEIKKIHWLKIDVEGHELDVLSGAKKMFSIGAVDLVTFEFGGCNIDTRTYFRDFFNFFEEKGMIVYRITPSGYFKPITRYRETEEQFTTVNYVAFREGI
jgi:FkbM family methyltransferase